MAKPQSLPLVALTTLLTFGFLQGRAHAAGSSPADAIPFDVAGHSLQLTLPSSSASIWLRAAPPVTVQATHFELQTAGSVDTILRVFASYDDAVANEPLASDDDSGPGLNAWLRVPIAFVGPYFIRVSGYSAGTFTLRGDLAHPAEVVRCDWPEGCSLATAARGEPTATAVLATLREVDRDLLSLSARGKQVSSLYWRLSVDLVPAFLADSALRHEVFERVVGLLPLAEDALAAARDQDHVSRLDARDVENLTALVDLIKPHLSSQNSSRIADLWDEFDPPRHVGAPVADILAASGLVPEQGRSVTLLMKLRAEPEIDPVTRRTGVQALDRLIATRNVTAARSIHLDTPAHRAANLVSTVAIEVTGVADTGALIEQIAALPDVEWVELNGTMRALASTSDPYSSALWGLDAIRAPLAWNFTKGNCAALVAVVDTGLRPDLLDFVGRVVPEKGYDFAEDDPDPLDLFGHGTHVAGTIAATANNSASIAGVAPGVCFFAVKALDDSGQGTLEDVAAGIVYAADAGAKVINLSLGCDCSSNAVDEALAYAAGRDVVIVASAGNDGEEGVLYPASSVWTIGVGAVDNQLARASFSNWGGGLELVAPGVDVVSVFLDGESCLGSGTSMAAPHVSGVAALVRSLHPSMSRVQVTDTLLRTAKDLGAVGWDPNFGYGLVDAVAALGGGAQEASVSVVAVDPSAAESPLGTGEFTFRRTGSLASVLSVTLAWGGTAINSVDYQRLADVVTFPVGGSAVSLVLTPVDDFEVEPLETVVLTVIPGPGYGVGSSNSAIVTIASEDHGPSMSVTGPSAPQALTAMEFAAAAVGCQPRIQGWNWASSGLFFLSGWGTSAVTVTWTTPGKHKLTVTNRNCPGVQATVNVDVAPRQKQTFTLLSADGVIDPNRPTIIFTHGWQLFAVDSKKMWSCVTADCDSLSVDHSAREMLSELAGKNKLQFVWTGAASLSAWTAKVNSDAAATELARLLLRELGANYRRDVHFVGHSLGTVVNARAAARFLETAQGVEKAQFTALDRPDDVLVFGPEFFPVTLKGAMHSGLEFELDNYWSSTGWGVGKKTQGFSDAKVYNHYRPQSCPGCGLDYDDGLHNPGHLGNRFFIHEDDNDHSGVHQWYRWSMDPNRLGTGSCTGEQFGTWSRPGDQVNLHGSLNPCKNGWNWSLFGPNPGGFPPTTEPDTPAILEEPIGGGLAAREGAPPAAEAILEVAHLQQNAETQVQVPLGTRALRFRLTASGIASSDFVAVFLDSQLIWSGQASVLTAGTAVPIGPVPIEELTGSRRLRLEVVGGGGTKVQLSDLRAVRVIPTCSLPSTLCVTGSRFRVEAEWEDHQGNRGSAVPRTVSANDSGFFWFFDDSNLELVVKVLDACGFPAAPRYWIFAAGLTNVGVRLKVTDTWTGEVRSYTNPRGTPFQPVQDTDAFVTCDASKVVVEPGTGILRYVEQDEAEAPERSSLEPDVVAGKMLLLNGNRFEVNASWRTASGTTGEGTPVALTGDSGYFWFFNPGNIELVIKVLDACGFPAAPRFWVFAGGLTNVEVAITVRDTRSGQTRTYFNPSGTEFQPITDTNAFATCP